MINVRDYGAVGDGVADDTASIQAALDVAEANNGGWVYIPAGQYKLTDALTVSWNTRVTAHGALLFHDPTTAGHRLLTNFRSTDSYAGYTGRSHIAIEGGTWDCRGQSAAVDDMDNALGFAHASDITVRDVTVLNVAGYHGIEVNAVDGALIDNCRLHGFIDNSTGGTRDFSEAIQIDVADSGSVAIPLTDGTSARNITVRDCWMGPSDDLGPYGAFAGSHKVVGLYENITVRGGGCDATLKYGIRAAGWKDPIIEGVQLANTGGTAIWVYDGWNGIVRGNTVRTPGSNGVNSSRQNGVIISGNSVVSPVNYGYYLNGNYDTQVSCNHVYNGGSAGVKLTGGSSGCAVVANMIRKGSSATAVICDAGSGTANTVSHNVLEGFGTGAGVIDIRSGTVNTTIPDYSGIGENTP